MKSNYFKILLVAIGLSGMVLTSCKKASSSAKDDSISSQDANNVSSVLNTTSDDAASAAGQVSSYKSIILNNSNANLLVGATITDTSSTGIIISYDGITPCNGIIRSGTVTITNTGGIAWHLAGAQLTVTYNLTATEILTGYTYTFAGSHIVTNETGGLAWKVVGGLAAGTTVTHRITSSNMQITYPNGEQRAWTVDRTRSWSSNSGNTLYTVSLYSEATGGVTEQGTNRFGDAFTNTIIDTISATNNCSWRPYQGTWQHQVNGRTATVVFGTNTLGTHVGTPTYCGSYGVYGYYITYTNGTNTYYKFVSYWR